MLRFPVSLLTATALSHAIKQVVHHRLLLLKGDPEKAVRRPDCSCDCHMKIATSSRFPQNTVLEHEQSDSELNLLRSASAVLDDIREVLGLSVVPSTQTWLLCIS
jgi:hypothetical protein